MRVAQTWCSQRDRRAVGESAQPRFTHRQIVVAGRISGRVVVGQPGHPHEAVAGDAIVRTDRAQVRDALGFRPATRADEEALGGRGGPGRAVGHRLRETLLTRCRNEHLEPPGRVDRLVASARATATDRFCAATVARLDQDSADRVERLVADIDPTSPGPR